MDLTSYRTLGRSGLRVSPLGLGALTFDDGSWGSPTDDSFAILDQYIDLGGNFIDTANQYNGGASELTLGAYFDRHPDRRDGIVLATKFGGTLRPGDPNAGGAGRKAIVAQLDGSLRRLRTDYVDLYWMHQWDRHTPVEETLSTLDDLVRSGKVRYVGFSNTPAWWVAQAVTTAVFRGWEPACALQIQYSLLARTAEGEQLGAARALGLGITPWGALASGLLSGKYSRTCTRPEDSARARWTDPQLGERTFAVLDLLEDVARDNGTTVARAALAWVRQQSDVTSTILGARTLSQLRDNLSSLSVVLTDAQMSRLSAATEPAREYPYPFMDVVGIGFQQGETTINGIAPFHVPAPEEDVTT